MTKPQTTFLGIPIEGDITEADRRAKQRPLHEFSPIIQAVLSDPHIIEVGWSQYTPYFNDGDPCVFSANGIWVRTQGDVTPDDEDFYDTGESYSLDYGSGVLANVKEWNTTTRAYEIKQGLAAWIYTSYEKASALDDAIQSGAFDDVLQEAFGDHAEVTIAKDKIRVEHYSHD